AHIDGVTRVGRIDGGLDYCVTRVVAADARRRAQGRGTDPDGRGVCVLPVNQNSGQQHDENQDFSHVSYLHTNGVESRASVSSRQGSMPGVPLLSGGDAYPMSSAIRSVATGMAGALAVLLGSAAASAQATVDTDNSYSNVGAIMVWRVDDSGTPVELRGFCSGTLIRPRVMITAGHC